MWDFLTTDMPRPLRIGGGFTLRGGGLTFKGVGRGKKKKKKEVAVWEAGIGRVSSFGTRRHSIETLRDSTKLY